MNYSGNIKKMLTRLNHRVHYRLPVGDHVVDMNPLIGQQLRLQHDGVINCISCGRKTSKSFNQGYCYPCLRSLAQCDSCIIKPELCHFAEGTCREPDWGLQHCMQDHYVYLANASGVKVGITRGTQVPTRWMDQGAIQALPIFRTRDRLTAGLVEVILKGHVADKTSWQRMLKGRPQAVDLPAQRDRLIASCQQRLDALMQQQGQDAVCYLDRETPVDIHYPVEHYPQKVTSLNFDKTPELGGTLQGIKGQYLIFDSGVLNIRKFGGYHIVMET